MLIFLFYYENRIMQIPNYKHIFQIHRNVQSIFCIYQINQ